MKKQQLAALCLAAGLALTGITSPVSAAQTDAGISISADSLSNPQTISAEENGAGTDSNSNSTNQNHHTDSTDATISPEQADQTTPVITEKPTDTTNPTDPSESTDPTDPTEPSNPGKPDTPVKNGVCYDEDADTWNIYKDGELAEPCNGLYDTEEGWLYIVDGKFQKDYTGLAANGAGWWRIVDGKVDFSCNGLVDSEYGWWYLRGGRIDFEYTGLAQNEYGWWYIENGGLYFNATGLAQNEYGWFYVRNSKVDFGFTGLANNEVGWWYVRNGQIDFSYNGLMCYFDTWWKITGGKVDFDYTGIVPNEYGWWRVKNGQIDFSFNNIASNEYGWFYLNGGKVDFAFTGVAENENGWWYIRNGILDFTITGNYVDGIRTYNVSNGRVIGCNFYLPQTSIILPDGGYNLSTANIGLKVIKVNQAVCGNSSERYTSSTASAVKTFQRTHGLGVTGIVDITTWKAMGYSEYDWYNLGTYRTPIKVFNGATREYRINAMLQTAAEYASAGTKYKVGCSGTPGTYVDCSGLIYQCLYAAGINPASNIVDHALAIYEYTSANLAADNRLGIEVASYDLQPGDLVFYAKNGKNSVCHIAIYAGNGCIYDSWPGIGVSYRSLNISGYHTVKIRRAF